MYSHPLWNWFSIFKWFVAAWELTVDCSRHRDTVEIMEFLTTVVPNFYCLTYPHIPVRWALFIKTTHHVIWWLDFVLLNGFQILLIVKNRYNWIVNKLIWSSLHTTTCVVAEVGRFNCLFLANCLNCSSINCSFGYLFQLFINHFYCHNHTLYLWNSKGS